jgi:hypothetical protein
VPSISLSSELISKGAVQPVQLQKIYKNHIYQLKLKTTHTRERERERERERNLTVIMEKTHWWRDSALRPMTVRLG